MFVTITGLVGDSAGREAAGRIEFTQMQRIDTGEMLVTSTVATAQVVNGELRALDGQPFQLPSNPTGTAVRILESLGGKTFVWFAAVPEVDAVEYREIPRVEASDVPASVFAPPAWLADVETARDETIDAIAAGAAVADALGGLPGITAAVESAESAAASADGSAVEATVQAVRAEAAADSIDMTALNARMSDMDTEIADKISESDEASRVYGTDSSGGQALLWYGQSATDGMLAQRGPGGRLPGVGAPTDLADAATKAYVDGRTQKNPFLRQATLWSYGHSFTSVPNGYCTPNGGEHPLRLKSLIGFYDVKAFGRGATPLPDTVANAMNNSRVSDLSRNWPGLDTIASTGGAESAANDPDERLMPRGVVTIQNYINEIGLGLVSAEYITFWKHCLRTLIAVTGGKAQRSYGTAIGPVGNAWNEDPSATLNALMPKGQLPKGELARTNKIGDYREYRVRGDSCWVVVLATKGSAASGNIDVMVGSTKVQTLSPMGMMPAEYASVIEASASVGGWPIALKVSGLNAAGGAGWKTIRLQATQAVLTYMSVVLVERLQPPTVLVAYEPTRKDTAPATWVVENAKYKAAIDQVVAEFPQAHTVDLDSGWNNATMTPDGNFHPNDRGQANHADVYARRINQLVTDWGPGMAVL